MSSMEVDDDSGKPPPPPDVDARVAPHVGALNGRPGRSNDHLRGVAARPAAGSSGEGRRHDFDTLCGQCAARK